MYYRVYLTKATWTPDQPLTWDSLELLVETEPRSAAAIDNIDVTLPERAGKHVMYSIWQRSLTGEAFYATSDVDFGGTMLPNIAPEASISIDNGLCGGPDIDFSAIESYDANGDELTYTWDFGDGTTGEGVDISHSYTDIEIATVTLTVSDGEFTTNVEEVLNLVAIDACLEPSCPYDTPTIASLPSINTNYEYIHVLGENGPDLTNITNFVVNWNSANNGLYQFAANTNNGMPSWYIDLIPLSTQSFNSNEPEITITGSGFISLDGSYYVTTDNGNLVLVSKTAGFTLYFSNSDEVPDCNHHHGMNMDPVALLTATPISGTGPLAVTFDASASSDVDGDILNYSIDYGDGTIGSEVISTHTYTIGEYIATITVSDGNGGTDSASVSITVNDNIINPPTSDCSFNTPIAIPLASVNESYAYVYVLGDGGPDLESLSLFTINWDLANNGLYQFSFNLNTAPWYIDFSSVIQNFNAINPEISLINTGIEGLDGDYYVALDQENFVLVTDGYSIYFSNSTTAPICESVENNAKNTVTRIALKKAEKYSFNMFPNPGITNVTLQNKTDLNGSTISIMDLSGKQIKSMSIIESTATINIDVSQIKTGLYLIKIIDPSGSSKSQKLIIK